jgi:hypothetical protein
MAMAALNQLFVVLASKPEQVDTLLSFQLNPRQFQKNQLFFYNQVLPNLCMIQVSNFSKIVSLFN